MNLDCSCNSIAFLPDTFSQLDKLEICNLDNNSILLSLGRFNSLTSLKRLSMRHNESRVLYHDVQGLTSVSLMDLSHNKIEWLPPEIGLVSGSENIHTFTDVILFSVAALTLTIPTTMNRMPTTMNRMPTTMNRMPTTAGNRLRWAELTK